MDENKGNNQNKEHVVNEMNDYISSTMSIPVIKLNDNINNEPNEETTDHSEEVTEIYSTTVSEEKSDLGREMFAAPTPTTPVEESTPVVEEKVVVEETKMEVPTPLPVEESKVEEIKEPVVEETPQMNVMNNIEQTHVDFSEPKVKKKSKAPLVVALLVLLIAIGSLGYFVIYPMIQSKFMSNPKNVFEATIKENAKNVNAVIENVPITNVLYDINVKLNSNVETLSPYAGYTYGIRAGVDVNAKAMEASLYLKDKDNNDYYINTYLKDGKDYYKLSTSDQLLDMGSTMSEAEITDSFAQIEAMLSEINVSNEDMQYLVTKVSDLFIESIDEKKLSQEKSTITLNSAKVDVEKNTYIIDKDNYKRTIKFILEGIEKDEKAKKIVTEYIGTEISEVIKELDSTDMSNIPTIKISIYTAGKKKDVVGYNIVADDKEVLYYYFDDKGFEFKINDVTLSEGVEVTAETNIDLRVTGVKDGNKTNVSIKVSDEEVASLVVNKWDEKGIDLTYVINVGEDQKINGALKVSTDKGNDYTKTNIVFSIETGADRLSVEVNINASTSAKIADIDTATAVVPSDVEMNMIMNNFITSLSNTPVGALLGSIGGMYDDDVNGQLNQYYDANQGTNPLDSNYIET